MSEMRNYSGKIELIEKLKGETFEELCKRIFLERTEDEQLENCTNYEEALFEEFWEDEYVKCNDNLYKITYLMEKDFSENSVDLIETSNGEYEFDARFYDGGTCVSEMIEKGLKKLQ